MGFFLFNLIAAATEVANNSKAEASSSSGLSVWWPTLGGLLGVLITALIGYWNNRPKNQNDQFKVFMDESSEFREEMRKEREAVKAELKEAKAKTESLQFELKAYQVRLQSCNDELEECQILVNKMKESFVKPPLKITLDSQELLK